MRMREPLRAIAGDVAKALKPALARRGLAAARIVTDWPDIVGALLADGTQPERLIANKADAVGDGPAQGGTLVVRVRSALALELQHLEPLVIERINGHFGFRAVGRLRLVQGPVAGVSRPPVKIEREPDPAALAALDASLAGVTDDALRHSLRRLGWSLLVRAAAKST
jgi:hypothetical protein